jgi:RNA polymerase subunit RPABC4/transcription elongation factor Spt4
MADDLTMPPATNSGRRSYEKYCSACSRVMHVHALYCPTCGAPQYSENDQQPFAPSVPQSGHKASSFTSSYCWGCGKTIHISAISCPHCGAQQRSAFKSGSKDKNVAGLFALLLGAIGAHHFYLGNIGLGLLYLIFCWTFIPMIIGFIEGIVYLTQSDESFSKRYP